MDRANKHYTYHIDYFRRFFFCQIHSKRVRNKRQNNNETHTKKKTKTKKKKTTPRKLTKFVTERNGPQKRAAGKQIQPDHGASGGPRPLDALLWQDQRDDRDQVGPQHVPGDQGGRGGPGADHHLRGGRRLSADQQPQVEVHKRRVAAGHQARSCPAQVRVQASGQPQLWRALDEGLAVLQQGKIRKSASLKCS